MRCVPFAGEALRFGALVGGEKTGKLLSWRLFLLPLFI